MAYEIEALLMGFESVQELALLLVIKNRFIIILVNRKEREFKYNKKCKKLKVDHVLN
jgi:hypothetical protein